MDKFWATDPRRYSDFEYTAKTPDGELVIGLDPAPGRDRTVICETTPNGAQRKIYDCGPLQLYPYQRAAVAWQQAYENMARSSSGRKSAFHADNTGSNPVRANHAAEAGSTPARIRAGEAIARDWGDKVRFEALQKKLIEAIGPSARLMEMRGNGCDALLTVSASVADLAKFDQPPTYTETATYTMREQGFIHLRKPLNDPGKLLKVNAVSKTPGLTAQISRFDDSYFLRLVDNRGIQQPGTIEATMTFEGERPKQHIPLTMDAALKLTVDTIKGLRDELAKSGIKLEPTALHYENKYIRIQQTKNTAAELAATEQRAKQQSNAAQLKVKLNGIGSIAENLSEDAKVLSRNGANFEPKGIGQRCVDIRRLVAEAQQLAGVS